MDSPILKIELQRTPMDCGIAVLAMLLGHSYEEVLMAAGACAPTLLTTGMYWKQLRTVAKKLGFTSKLTSKIDLEEDAGALNISSERWHNDHLVVLKQGLIVDTDGSLWDVDVFMSAYAATPGRLMTFEKIA